MHLCVAEGGGELVHLIPWTWSCVSESVSLLLCMSTRRLYIALQKVHTQDGMFDISDDEHPPVVSAETQVEGQGSVAKGIEVLLAAWRCRLVCWCQ